MNRATLVFVILFPMALSEFSPRALASGGPHHSSHAKDRKRLAATVELVGNHAIDEPTLRKVMGEIECDPRHEIEAITVAITHGPVAECKSVEDLAGTVETYYIANGYLLAKATASTELSRSKVTIEEGTLFQVGAIEITEVGSSTVTKKPTDPQKPKPSMALKTGAPFSRQNVWDEIAALRKRYAAAGDKKAVITPSVSIHPEERTVDILIDVQHGPKN